MVFRMRFRTGRWIKIVDCSFDSMHITLYRIEIADIAEQPAASHEVSLDFMDERALARENMVFVSRLLSRLERRDGVRCGPLWTKE